MSRLETETHRFRLMGTTYVCNQIETPTGEQTMCDREMKWLEEDVATLSRRQLIKFLREVDFVPLHGLSKWDLQDVLYAREKLGGKYDS